MLKPGIKSGNSAIAHTQSNIRIIGDINNTKAMRSRILIRSITFFCGHITESMTSLYEHIFMIAFQVNNLRIVEQLIHNFESIRATIARVTEIETLIIFTLRFHISYDMIKLFAHTMNISKNIVTHIYQPFLERVVKSTSLRLPYSQRPCHKKHH